MAQRGQSVVTIGGATAERVLVVDPRGFRPGGKQTLPPQRILAGGSAVNQACRLLATGTDVQPIVPLCRDSFGAIVEAAMADAAARGGSRLLGGHLFVEGNGLTTPFTTITSVGDERTIYTEYSTELFAPFEAHLEARLGAVDGSEVGALMLGHLHADGCAPAGRAGALSRRCVEVARARGIAAFVNLGSSQYRLGADGFTAALPDVACFQLDIGEMRTFVGGPDNPPPSLADILAWFEDRCTVVVTLERMGAVGRLRGSRHIVLTWPYEIDVVDTTGAGDAFAAGMVSSMLVDPLTDDDALCRAMDRGGLFAAHACLTPGGADGAPTWPELEAFRASNSRMLDTEVTTIADASKILRLLDQAFPARR
jgi:sugar/nucleoside kinase (ribokinase family)